MNVIFMSMGLGFLSRMFAGARIRIERIFKETLDAGRQLG